MKSTTIIGIVAIIAVAAIIIVGMLVFMPQLGQNNSKTIDVQGTSSITKPADKATLSIGVETTAATAKEAEANNTKISNELYDALKGLGLTEKDYKTQSFNVYPQQKWEDGQSTVIGYTAQHMISIDTEQLDKVSEILGAAVKAGANNIYGVNFDLTQDTRENARAEAYKKATEYARIKADSIAEGLGVKITGIERVSDSNYDYMPYRSTVGMAEFAQAKDSASGAPTPVQVESGEVTVTANIAVSYGFK